MFARQLDFANPTADRYDGRRGDRRQRENLRRLDWRLRVDCVLVFIRASGGLQADHQAVAGSVPGVAERNQEVEHNPGDGRLYLILLGADGQNVFALNWNPPALQSNARVG